MSCPPHPPQFNHLTILGVENRPWSLSLCYFVTIHLPPF
jgi:hypothetical protein